MKHLSMIVAVLATTCGASSAYAQEVVQLTIGQVRALDAGSPIAKVVIEKPGLVSAHMNSNHSLELTGMKPGETGVKLSLRSAKDDGPSYTVQVIEDTAAAAQALQADLRGTSGFEGVTVSRSGPHYSIGGEVKDLETHAQLARTIEGKIGKDFTDTVSVTGGQMVAVDVRFYAVATNTLKELGFNFSYLGGDIKGSVVSPNSLQSFDFTQAAGLTLKTNPALQGAFNLLVASPKSGAIGMLSALNNAGLSQVLAQPTLLVRSGEQADFLAGGDVPIPVPQGGATSGAISIDYRPYGVRLTVAPTVMSDRRIVLKLSPEVSELDYTNQITVQGTSVPGFRRRSASTTVELGDGQSFVIAGLTYMTGNSNEAKVPGLGELPILGALFKTSQYTRERQELIIVATPRLVSPLDRDPIKDVTIDGNSPSLGQTLANSRQLSAEIQSVGLSR